MDGVEGDAVGVRRFGDALDLRRRIERHPFEHRGTVPALLAAHFIDEIEHLAARLHLKAFRRQNENFLALDSG